MAGALVVVCAAAGGEARASAGGDRGGASVRAPLARVLTPAVTAEDSQALTSTSVTVVASTLACAASRWRSSSSRRMLVVDRGMVR